MRATGSRALPLHRGKPCPAGLIAFSRPASSLAFATDPIALMGNGMGRKQYARAPSPWAGRVRAEAELPHIDPRRGVLSTELGLTRVERIGWLREKPARRRAVELLVWWPPRAQRYTSPTKPRYSLSARIRRAKVRPTRE